MTTVLRLDHVTKAFGPVKVIQDVSVDVIPGRVRVLLGENGAGKTTLIKMMSGIYHPDSGSVVIDDTPVELPTVKAAEARGIATIHQELNLVPQMSVAENIMLGRTPSRGGLVNWGLMRAQARAALERIGLDVSPDRLVGSLSTAHQQLVEIARALSMDARVLILDEPTAALTRKESGQLFEVMDDLKTKGVAMVFISHHLDEIPRVGDDVSVLLSVTGLSRERAFQDVGFDLHAGEVLGLAGLVGAGRTEVLRAIAGADKYDSGTVRVRGKELPKGKISRAIVDGIGHVPEERKSQGLVLDASVNENLGYATMKSTSHAGLVDRSGQRRRAQNVAEKLRVRMASLDQPVRNLSGGNQQKVVIGRWILAGSSILLLDELTRGVDVGAKVEIYQLINAVTDAGGAVLMVSSELPEVIGMSDRILVMSHGRAMGILDAKTATEDAVMELAVASVDPVDEKTG